MQITHLFLRLPYHDSPILAHVRSAAKVVLARHLLRRAQSTLFSDLPLLGAPEGDIASFELPLLEHVPVPSVPVLEIGLPKWDWRMRSNMKREPETAVGRTPGAKRARRIYSTPQPLAEGDKWYSEALRYREHFTTLLDAERAEEETVLRERLATWSLQRLQEQGYALTDLSAYWVEKQSAKPLKTISFQLGPGVILPANRFENGTQVLISRFDPLKEVPARGSVLSHGKSHIRIGVEQVFDVDGQWRMDVGGSTILYERMVAAVKSLGQNYTGGVGMDGEVVACVGTPLTDVILHGFSQDKATDKVEKPVDGIFSQDMRIRSWATRYMRPNPIVIDGDPPLEGLNSSQKRAIAMMIGERFSLIQGPPGTGKTRTIIETVKLLKNHFSVPHPLLVCTYTNVAVDNLVEGMVAAGLKPLRVAYAGKMKQNLEEYSLEWKLQRHPLYPATETLAQELEAISERISQLRDILQKDANNRQTKVKVVALQRRHMTVRKRLRADRNTMVTDAVSEADVICTTCITSAASVLGVADFPIVFLDEASMSTEPASLVPLTKGAKHVSLIGDHKQLPPVITSSEAKALGLGVSLFERLIEEGRVPSIMLDIQYRMHPAISAFPSLEFYDLELRDGIGGQEPLKGMPTSVVFIDHAGAESTRDRSRVNWNEAHIVMGVVEELLASNENLRGEDIGIIAPYAAQISLLTRLLTIDPLYAARFEHTLGYRALQLKHVEIKTVDGFEGREKEVIIFSTVRNNPRGEIGFLADRGRLNVGLTRAKRGLFVVGSVDTLKRGKGGRGFEDEEQSGWRAGGAESWRRYAGYCVKEGLVVQLKQNQLGQALYGVS